MEPVDCYPCCSKDFYNFKNFTNEENLSILEKIKDIITEFFCCYTTCCCCVDFITPPIPSGMKAPVLYPATRTNSYGTVVHYMRK